MIHEEEQTDNGTEKTTDVWNHSIELDKSTDIVMFSCCFSEPEARVPSISHFLRGNRVGSRDNSSVFLHIISIWQNTVIRLNVILRNEDLMWCSELTSKIYKVSVLHVVWNCGLGTGSDESIDIINWKMYLTGQFCCQSSIVHTIYVCVDGSTPQDVDF